MHGVKLPPVSLPSVSLEMQPAARLGLSPHHHLSSTLSVLPQKVFSGGVLPT